MSCKVKKQHRKRHPMSKKEKFLWEICFKMTGNQVLSMLCVDRALYHGRKRKVRDAFRDAGRNPYKRGGKK